MSKNGHFSNFFLFRRYSPENCLLRYSKTINALLGYKNKKFKKTKNWHFSNRVNPWFWWKNGHFSKLFFRQYRPENCLFFLGNIGQEIVFYDILELENAFLGYKKKKFKISKNRHSSKGVNPWFWSKNGNFSTFFFRQYRPEKFLLRYSKTKKRVSRL